MCDPLVEGCLFSSSLEINLGQHDFILNDYQARLSFDSIAKTWLNIRNECTNHTENYWGINVDPEPFQESRFLISSSSRRQRRRGKSKGLCKGGNCPKRIVFSEPDRRRLEESTALAFEECDTSLLNLLRESDPRYFGKLEEIELHFDSDVENEEVDKCITDSCRTQFNATDKICADFGIVYNQSAHECSWNSVNCNVDDLIVTSLSFFEVITSTIPTDISLLHELEWFYVPSNNLFGAIPTEVGLMSRLKGFTVPSNELSGEIPSQVGQAGALTVIDLSNNKLVGTIPTEIGNLKLLDSLTLTHNALTGTIPVEVISIEGLERLDLSVNDIDGAIPKEIGTLQLRYLDLSGNNLTGSIPPEIENLADTLEYLDLRGNNLTGVIPSELCDKMKYDIGKDFGCEFTRAPTLTPTNVVDLRDDRDCSKKYSSISYEMKYFKKWPRCENLGCFSTERGKIEKFCNKNSDCDGFSYTSGEARNGWGCLKQCANDDARYGYKYDTHDYWEKNITSSCGYEYEFFPFMESEGNDIGNFKSLSGAVEDYKKICDLESTCRGFNSNGLFKDFVKPRRLWKKWTNDPTLGLYVKKELLAPPNTDSPSIIPSTIVFPETSPPTVGITTSTPTASPITPSYSDIPSNIPSNIPSIIPPVIVSPSPSVSPTINSNKKKKKKEKDEDEKNNDKDKDKNKKNRNNIFL